jgi:hypothetical protein
MASINFVEPDYIIIGMNVKFQQSDISTCNYNLSEAGTSVTFIVDDTGTSEQIGDVVFEDKDTAQSVIYSSGVYLLTNFVTTETGAPKIILNENTFVTASGLFGNGSFYINSNSTLKIDRCIGAGTVYVGCNGNLVPRSTGTIEITNPDKFTVIVYGNYCTVNISECIGITILPGVIGTTLIGSNNTINNNTGALYTKIVGDKNAVTDNGNSTSSSSSTATAPATGTFGNITISDNSLTSSTGGITITSSEGNGIIFSNQTNIIDSTVSDNTTTGALIVAGGVGVGGALRSSSLYVGGNRISGVNTGDQTITLTGEVSGSGTGSFATTVSNSSVISKVLTGYVSSTGTVTATDTILQAIQKINGNTLLKIGGSGVNGQIAYFNSSTSVTSNSALTFNGTAISIGNISINGNTISSSNTNGNLSIIPNGSGKVLINTDPVDLLGVATKGYVDSSDSKKACRVRATTLPSFVASGSGIGKTITGSVNGALIVDTITTVLADRILVDNDTSNSGIYEVTIAGNGSTAFRLTRTTDADTSSKVRSGMTVYIQEGVSFASKLYALSTTGIITVDTTPLTFIQISSQGVPLTTHNQLSGLLADDHPQYLLLSGRVGGQIIANTINFSNVTAATNATTASVTLSGGLGVSGNVIIGNSTSISGITTITNATNSTNNTTGALIVSGGVGISGDVFTGGSFNSAGIMILSNNTQSTNTTTGTLVLSGAASGLGMTGNLNVGGSIASNGIISTNNATNSTTTSSGALIVSGGVGIGGNVFIGGAIRTTSVTNSSSTTTGSLIANGGVGIAGNVFVGGTIRTTNATSSVSTSTGALIIAGGAGIAGAVYVGSLFVNGNQISGVNSGDQVITLTGEVTGSGTGSFTTTVSNSSVISKVLTGYVSSTGTVAGTDTILQAIQKINGNNELKLSGAGTVSSIPFYSASLVLSNSANLTYSGGTLGILDTTVSDSTTTGALVVSGGAGIAGTAYVGNLFVGGNQISGVNSGDQVITLTGEVTGSGTGSFTTTVSNSSVLGKVLTGYVSGAGTVVATDTILGAFQKINGNTALCITGSGTSSRIPFYSASLVLSNSANLTYGSGKLSILDTTVSNSTSTGALVVSGGAGIAGATYVGSLFVGGNQISGVNSGDQVITLTGEVSGSGTGSFATTVSNSSVINKVLTGYVSGSGTVTAADTILGAVQKINGNTALCLTGSGINNRIPFYSASLVLSNSANLTYGAGTFRISDTTVSNSTSTGALIVSGGVGIAGTAYIGSLFVGGNQISGVNSGDQVITLTGDVSGSGTGSFATTVSNSSVISKVLTGYVSGAGTVAATDTILQAIQKINGNDILKLSGSGTSNRIPFYSASLVLSNSANLTYGSGILSILDTTTSNTTTSGALVVSGGAGINGNLFVGGTIRTTNTTISTSTSTGAMVSNGGLGVAGAAYVGSLFVGGNQISGVNSGDQVITLTGEVSGSGTGSFSTTVSNSSVISKVLTGYVSGAGTVAATDTILGAIQKINGNDTLRLSGDGVATYIPFYSASRTLSSTANFTYTTGKVSMLDTTVSNSITTGALVVSGGVGIAGNINIGGAITTGNFSINSSSNSITNNAADTDITIVTNGTGRVSVSDDPIDNLHVATKQYIDNLFIRITAYKNTNETRANNTTLTADTNLSGISIPSTGTYAITGLINISSSSSTPDIKVGFSISTSTVNLIRAIFTKIGSGSTTCIGTVISANNTSTPSISIIANEVASINVNGVINVTNAGTLNFIWAQVAANAASTNVLAGSYIQLQKIA